MSKKEGTKDSVSERMKVIKTMRGMYEQLECQKDYYCKFMPIHTNPGVEENFFNQVERHLLDLDCALESISSLLDRRVNDD